MVVKKTIENHCYICKWNMRYLLKWIDLNYTCTLKKFDIYRCDKCWLEQVYPLLSQEELLEYYPKNYYSYEKDETLSLMEKIVYKTFDDMINKRKTIYSIIFKNRIWKFPKKKLPNWNYLDIWCWAGKHLKVIEKYWRNTYGFEIWDKNHEWKIKYDMHIKNVDWKIKFDFISIWAVFEHLLDPEWYLKEVKNILKDDWELNIFLPNNNSIYARLFWPFRFNRDIPRHIYNYNPTALKMLLEKNWFKIKKIKHLSAWWFFTSLYHLLDYRFWVKIWILNNIRLHLLFYPIDWIINILWFGDNIHLNINKKND